MTVDRMEVLYASSHTDVFIMFEVTKFHDPCGNVNIMLTLPQS